MGDSWLQGPLRLLRSEGRIWTVGRREIKIKKLFGQKRLPWNNASVKQRKGDRNERAAERLRSRHRS